MNDEKMEKNEIIQAILTEVMNEIEKEVTNEMKDIRLKNLKKMLKN
jgi:hypothetical protein